MATLPFEAVGLGERPALIIVDATLGFTDPASPLGAPSEPELAVIAALAAAFRQRGWPVVYTVNEYADPGQAVAFRRKLPVLEHLVAGGAWSAIHPQVAPVPGDLVLSKALPSAFFDTPLRGWLAARGVDSAVVCGFSTSGCVRATAVDALQCGLRLTVVADACGDRDRAAHAANLRDLGLKYGDVLTADTLLATLAGADPA